MDDLIRLAAFNWLNDQKELQGDVLPRKLLESGFTFQNQRVHVIGPQGIFTPYMMNLPISITTSPKSKYLDRPIKEGVFEYSYRGSDLYHRDNVGLRDCMRLQKPLIYFIGIDPGWYFPSFPVFTIHDDPSRLIFTVQADQQSVLSQPERLEETDATHWRRAYATITTEVRLHQQRFRFRVLLAYQNQCSLCQLKHPELLDAAHIIGDREGEGDPIVQNGLSLCKIHHAAFDKNIIGINPDYHVQVRNDILEETDGPMLKYGLQALDRQKIILPNHHKDYPDRERLEQRFDRFLRAS
ncbi:MAG: HNH endonuclease [Bacteroidota bacterium]